MERTDVYKCASSKTIREFRSLIETVAINTSLRARYLPMIAFNGIFLFGFIQGDPSFQSCAKPKCYSSSLCTKKVCGYLGMVNLDDIFGENSRLF
jgi:hypothetical protein